MKKRIISLLLAVVLLAGLVPVHAASVSEEDEAAIYSAVEAVIKAYAKQVYRANADDDAFSTYFRHGFFGNGKKMVLTESLMVFLFKLNTITQLQVLVMLVFLVKAVCTDICKMGSQCNSKSPKTNMKLF